MTQVCFVPAASEMQRRARRCFPERHSTPAHHKSREIIFGLSSRRHWFHITYVPILIRIVCLMHNSSMGSTKWNQVDPAFNHPSECAFTPSKKGRIYSPHKVPFRLTRTWSHCSKKDPRLKVECKKTGLCQYDGSTESAIPFLLLSPQYNRVPGADTALRWQMFQCLARCTSYLYSDISMVVYAPKGQNDIRLLQILDLVLGQRLPSRNDAVDALDLCMPPGYHPHPNEQRTD